MHALIVVDVQNDFLPGGALAVPAGDEVIAVANTAMGHVRAAGGLVVATQDFHPADHLSFASRHPGREVGDVIDLDGLPQVLWPDHCVQDTPGCALAAGLHAGPIERVFPKGTDRTVDSYSGFFDNGRRRATGLGDYLRRRGVSVVTVLGLATDYCVKATAIDAAAEGFATRLLVPGTRGVELAPGDVAAALDAMRDAGVEMIDSVATLAAGARP